ncbi:MAG: hypothetical protein IJ029_04855 [Lachnospiraceae bacterium]|nr:hypothetical protein [Lachnospiraceae bacterium]
MKQGKIITGILTIANIILVVLCLVFFLQADRKEPEFEFHETETVYREGMDVAKLLEGITAYDDADGDISNRIVLEKIIENEKEDNVVVYYAVSDKTGNVAKCSRVFPAVLLADSQKDANSDEQAAELLMEAGVSAELDDEEKKAEQTVDVEAVTETESEENAEAAATPTPTASPTSTATPTPTPEQETVQEQEPAVQQPAAPAVNPAAPVLTLNTTQIVVQRGVNPPWVNSISVLKDDKDSYETLFQNIQISKFNVNEPGNYPVTLYTEDSDGNRSATVSVTIVVK